MKKFIFTFPGNHPLKGHYQPIFAKNGQIARERMFERYGDAWGFQYTEEEWIEWENKSRKLDIPIERELSNLYCKEVN